jgi:16S rRNA U1498 N3-methylase RsmE
VIKAMFDYMRTKNGNIIAVVDKKKRVYRAVLKTIQKEFRSSLSKKTEVCLQKVKSLLVKGKMNYVVMETEYLDDKKTTMQPC